MFCFKFLLKIIDDSRNWWKAKNSRGQAAHVPHTIVTPYNYMENGDSFNNPLYPQNFNKGANRQTSVSIIEAIYWLNCVLIFFLIRKYLDILKTLVHKVVHQQLLGKIGFRIKISVRKENFVISNNSKSRIYT